MARPIRLLLVEDSENDAALVLENLRRTGWDVTWDRVQTRDAMRAALGESTPDLIISDNTMPTFSATEALAVWKEIAPDIPFVVVSGTIGEEQAVELIKAGAHDFLLKDRLSRLDSAVERVLGDAEGRISRRQLEAQLRQAQKMEAIGRLAGGVAHDFNNILGVIQGEAQLLLGQMSPEDPQRGHVEQIHTASARAAALTHQLLSFSKSQVLEARAVDLNQSVAGLVGMLDRLVGKGIEIVFERGEPLRRVLADPTQIEQILMNLTLNARDAMPQGGRLTFATADEELTAKKTLLPPGAPSGHFVSLTVSDTGHGMSEEVRARAFEPFFTTKEADKGTGVGLATVYGIVKRSGGFIQLASESGVGTTFKVYLPGVDAVVEAASTATTAQACGGTETVLLAEDEMALRKLVQQVLERKGYRVLAAADSIAALAVAKAYDAEIHLLLTDLVMPGMSGRELAARLREFQPEVRIVYMSGYTEDALIDRGGLEPGTLLISKPFSMDALLQKLRQALGARPVA